ncbi:hypothetical protein DERF_014177 [Dermatophagoides farinae]|uniref:Uncharacterized protein n=1 Tax=Dermatophagoides farinae TaxID=6954 RepID=A0A922HNI6_DERFA|nr:hypothetical protein DERF_014177 [Dermatophagoides farinae]
MDFFRDDDNDDAANFFFLYIVSVHEVQKLQTISTLERLSSSYKNNINIDIKILYIHCYRHQLYPQVPHQDQQIL